MTTSKRIKHALIFMLLLTAFLTATGLSVASASAFADGGSSQSQEFRVYVNGWEYLYDEDNEWQTFVVPTTGTYIVNCYGAPGGDVYRDEYVQDPTIPIPTTISWSRLEGYIASGVLPGKVADYFRYEDKVAIRRKYFGGKGGYVSAKMYLEEGQTLLISPGKQGKGGSWSFADGDEGGTQGMGGKASYVAYDSTTNVLLAGAGGGGASKKGTPGVGGGTCGGIEPYAVLSSVYVGGGHDGQSSPSGFEDVVEEDQGLLMPTGFCGGQSAMETFGSSKRYAYNGSNANGLPAVGSNGGYGGASYIAGYTTQQTVHVVEDEVTEIVQMKCSYSAISPTTLPAGFSMFAGEAIGGESDKGRVTISLEARVSFDNEWTFTEAGQTAGVVVPYEGEYLLTCYGAVGGDALTDGNEAVSGGAGGLVQARAYLHSGDVLYVYVGKSGADASSAGESGGGGEETYVMLSHLGREYMIMAAAGGGGASPEGEGGGGGFGVPLDIGHTLYGYDGGRGEYDGLNGSGTDGTATDPGVGGSSYVAGLTYRDVTYFDSVGNCENYSYMVNLDGDTIATASGATQVSDERRDGYATLTYVKAETSLDFAVRPLVRTNESQKAGEPLRPAYGDIKMIRYLQSGWVDLSVLAGSSGGVAGCRTNGKLYVSSGSILVCGAFGTSTDNLLTSAVVVKNVSEMLDTRIPYDSFDQLLYELGYDSFCGYANEVMRAANTEQKCYVSGKTECGMRQASGDTYVFYGEITEDVNASATPHMEYTFVSDDPMLNRLSIADGKNRSSYLGSAGDFTASVGGLYVVKTWLVPENAPDTVYAYEGSIWLREGETITLKQETEEITVKEATYDGETGDYLYSVEVTKSEVTKQSFDIRGVEDAVTFAFETGEEDEEILAVHLEEEIYKYLNEFGRAVEMWPSLGEYAVSTAYVYLADVDGTLPYVSSITPDREGVIYAGMRYYYYPVTIDYVTRDEKSGVSYTGYSLTDGTSPEYVLPIVSGVAYPENEYYETHSSLTFAPDDNGADLQEITIWFFGEDYMGNEAYVSTFTFTFDIRECILEYYTGVDVRFESVVHNVESPTITTPLLDRAGFDLMKLEENYFYELMNKVDPEGFWDFLFANHPREMLAILYQSYVDRLDFDAVDWASIDLLGAADYSGAWVDSYDWMTSAFDFDDAYWHAFFRDVALRNLFPQETYADFAAATAGETLTATDKRDLFDYIHGVAPVASEQYLADVFGLTDEEIADYAAADWTTFDFSTFDYDIFAWGNVFSEVLLTAPNDTESAIRKQAFFDLLYETEPENVLRYLADHQKKATFFFLVDNETELGLDLIEPDGELHYDDNAFDWDGYDLNAIILYQNMNYPALLWEYFGAEIDWSAYDWTTSSLTEEGVERRLRFCCWYLLDESELLRAIADVTTYAGDYERYASMKETLFIRLFIDSREVLAQDASLWADILNASGAVDLTGFDYDDVDWSGMDRSAVNQALYVGTADAGAYWDATDLVAFDFSGWYEIDGSVLSTAMRFVTIEPGNPANRCNRKMYAKMTLHPIVFTNDIGSDDEYIYNVGSVELTTPDFTHPLSYGVVSYEWSREENESMTGIPSLTTADVELLFGAAEALSSVGTYDYYVTVTVRCTLTYDTVSTTLAAEGVLSQKMRVVVLPKPLTHADIVITGATETRTYTGLARTQDITVSDKGEYLSSIGSGAQYAVSYDNNVNANESATTDAERASVTVSATLSSNYSGSVTFYYVIERKVVDGTYNTETPASVTYTGEEYTPTPAIWWVRAGADVTLTAGTDFDYYYANNRDAGTATVRFVAKGNYTGYTTVQFTIGKATPVFDVSAIEEETYAFLYDGDYNPVAQEITGATLNNAEQTITYGNNAFSDVPAGGTLTITLSVTESRNYLAGSTSVTVEIGKATSFADVSGVDRQYVYQYDDNGDGIEQFLTGSVLTVPEQSGNVSLYYKNTTTAFSFTDVPLAYDETGYYYEAYASVAASTNFLAATSESFRVYVAKAEYDVTLEEAGSRDFTYDGTQHTVEGFFTVKATQGATISYENSALFHRPQNGVCTVIATIGETRNFAGKEIAFNVTIGAATGSIVTTGIITEYTYDGTEIEVTGATATLVHVGDDAFVEISYENNVFVNVADSGNMTIRLVNKPGYYDYNEAETTVYVRIKKATPDLTGDVIALTATYGETVADVAGLPERVDGAYTIDQSASSSVGTVTAPTKLTLTFTPIDTDNWYVMENIRAYTPDEAGYATAKVTFTVSKASRTLDVSEVETAYVYRVVTQTFTGASIGDNEGTIVYTPANFTEVADMSPYAVLGEDDRYTLTIQVAETDDYLSAEAVLTVTVVKATSEIVTSGILAFTYDGNPHSVTTGAAIYNAEQTLVYSENSFTTVPEAEATTVIISAAETANYYAVQVAYAPILHRATPAIEYLGQTVFTYTGERQTVFGEVTLNNDEQRDSVTFSNNTFVTVPEGNSLVVRISVDQSDNYVAGEITFGIHVDKAVPSTRAQSVTVSYGRTLVNAIGLEVNYTFIDGTIDVGTVNDPVTGLLCKYTPPLGEEINYLSVDTVPLTVTVLKADPALNVTGVRTDYVYTGETYVIDSGATINNNEQTIVYDESTNSFTTVTEGNRRRVRIYVLTSDNYLASERTVDITMRKATPVLDLSGVATTYTYNREEQRVDGAVLAYGEGVIRYSANTFTTVEEGRSIGEVLVSVDATDNFTAISETVRITVNKARQAVTFANPSLTYTYNGERQTVLATIDDPEQQLVCENNTFITVAEGNGREVRYTASETANYEAISGSVLITVLKQEPELPDRITAEAYYGQILYDVAIKLPRVYTVEQSLSMRVGTPDNPRAVTLKYTPEDPDNVMTITGIPCELTVTKRPVTLTVDSIETVYGDDAYATQELTCAITEGSIVAGDTLDVVLVREAGEVPAEYAIEASVETELYDVTIVNGVYTIARRVIELDFPVKESYYGEEVVAPAYEIVAGETVFGDELTGDLAFASEPSIAGDYQVLCNVGHDNYDVRLVSDVYTVKRRPVVVYANVIESVYGEEPPYAYVVEAKEGVALTGEAMVGEDVFNGTLRLDNYNVGRRNILSDLFNANYEISFVGAYCTVTPASITIKANDVETTYGEGAAFTYEVTVGAVVEGDDLRASLVQGDPNVGEHAIEGSFYNANYTVTFVSATHTIVPRPITIKLGDQSKTRLEFIANGTFPNDEYTIVAGALIEGDDLRLLVTSNGTYNVGEYDLDATCGNPNYDVTVIRGKLHITKDESYITVDENSLTVVYDGEAHWVRATVSSGAKPEYIYKGTETEGSRIVPGRYVIRVVAPSTDLYYEPEPVEVTMTILQAEMTDEDSGVTVKANSSGFQAGEKLVIDDTVTEWDTADGDLPESYAVTASYVIKKVDARDNESSLEGEVTVTIALPKRYANRGTVDVALVANGETVIETAEVGEDGTITVSGYNLTKVAVIERQNTPTLAIILVIAAAAVVILFVVIMIAAGRAK